MAYNNKSLVDFLKKKLRKNTVYMYGDFMRKVTISTINAKVKQYPSHYTEARINYLKSLIGKDYYGCDCCGLIKAYFFTDGGTKALKYNKKYDLDAKGITIDTAKESGIMETMPEIPGLFLYMNGHCGVYIGNNEVIECTSNEKLSKKKFGGVCKTKLSDRKWKYWCKSKFINYDDNNKYLYVYNCEVLNVRSGPSTKYSIVNTIPKNTRIEVLEKTKYWTRIGYNQYISSSYLTTSIPNNYYPLREVVSKELNVRKNPNGVLTGIVLKYKTKVADMGSINGWTKILDNRYVYSKYLK